MQPFPTAKTLLDCVKKKDPDIDRAIVENDYDCYFEEYKEVKNEYKHTPKKLKKWILKNLGANTIDYAAVEAFEYFKFLGGI